MKKQLNKNRFSKEKSKIRKWMSKHDITLGDLGVCCKSLDDLDDMDIIQSLLDDIEEEKQMG
jgi:hypothetical protein